MSKRNFRRRVSQGAAFVLMHTLVFTSIPVYAAPQRTAAPAPMASTSAAHENVSVASGPTPSNGTAPAKAPAPPKVTVNRTVATMTAPSSTPTFSDAPTVVEIFRVRVFVEPFLPVGGEPTAQETAALANAIRQYLAGSDPEDVSAFGSFLNAHPTTAWRASLVTNLGAHYRATGYYTKAAETLQEGWELAKDQSGRPAHAIAERALSELLDLNMQFGKLEQLEALMADAQGRDLHGGVNERITQAQAAIYVLKEAHHEAIASAAVSVDQLQGYGKKSHRRHAEVARHLASHHGASLADVGDLAQRAGMQLRLARRGNLGDFVPGSIIHLKSGHFSALVRQEGDRFLLADPMLDLSGEVWVSRAALLDEGSGYALLPAASPSQGWESTNRQAVGHIRGKCVAAAPNPGATGPFNNSPNPPPSPEPGPGPEPEPGPDPEPEPGPDPDTCPPMAVYKFHSLLVSLSIQDTPVRYTPPRGPKIGFRVTYNQREAFQPTTFTYSNLGPRWNHDWLSYIEDTPADPLAAARVFTRGGGSEAVTGFAGDRFEPATASRAVVVRTSTSPISYERHLPDGSMQVFARPDTGVSPRRVFMTEWRDSAGNAATLTYDGLKIVEVRDAIGQVTTISYGLSADPLKITQVTDPVGRAAKFDYNASGALIKITDIIGITSEFAYGNGDFIRALTTPYGTTTFAHGVNGGHTYYPNLYVEATDPLGAQERLERVYMPPPTSPAFPLPEASEPSHLVPQGFTDNAGLNYRNSFYWDKRAMALHPGDYSKARIMRWLWEVNSVMTISDFMHSEKKPLENRVWYGHAGARAADSAGPDGRPAKIGRVLEDGTTQIYRYEYNARGMVCRRSDPLGRETRYTYGTGVTADPVCTAGSGIDLLKVEQKNGSAWDTVGTATYNAQHRPLTVTDAAVQTTTYTYLTDTTGRVQSIVTPPRNGHNGSPLTSAERTSSFEYFADTAPLGPGRLQRVVAPSVDSTPGPEINLTYDDFGRVRTTTDSDLYTMTFDYDVLDRLTRATYPDGSYRETRYKLLDADGYRDRLGRWTTRFHDALRRVTAIRDPLGRTVTFDWCGCGNLDRLVDAAGNATTWDRDLQGRITRETRADGKDFEYTYETATSRLKTVTDPKEQVKTYSYQLDNMPIGIAYAVETVATADLTFGYEDAQGTPDPYGRLRTMVDGTGTTAFAYYPAGGLGALGLKTVDGPLSADVIEYAYDELGRVKNRKLNGTTNEVGYVFDSLGRLRTQTANPGAFAYTYDGVSHRPDSIVYPSGQRVDYAYHPNSGDRLLQEIHNKVPGGATLSKFGYTYDRMGNIVTWSQQRGTASAETYSFAYDRVDQMTAATLKSAAGVILKSYGNAYDAAGNRITDAVDASLTTATYNNRNWLTAQAAGGSIPVSGVLDEGGTVTVNATPVPIGSDHRFSGQSALGTGTQTVTVIARDLSNNTRTNTYEVDVTGTAAGPFTHDDNGNLTSDGNQTYEWDAENRLVAVKQSANTVAAFSYDGRGRRYQKTAGGVVQTFLYDGVQMAEERLSTGGAIRYFDGPGIDQHLATQDAAGVVSYYAADHLGSITEVTTGAGTLSLTRQYDPWGQLLAGASSSGPAFTGRDWDVETGLYYYRARYYDPRIGRFLSEDPIRFRGGINFYSYVRNNPANLVDPLGLDDRWYLPGSVRNASPSSVYAIDMDGPGLYKVDPGDKFGGYGAVDIDFVYINGEWWKVRGPGTLTIDKDGKPSCLPGVCRPADPAETQDVASKVKDTPPQCTHE